MYFGVETPILGPPGGILCPNYPTIGFSCSYVLTKHKKDKNSMVEPSFKDI
jgi:hypothetical protein